MMTTTNTPPLPPRDYETGPEKRLRLLLEALWRDKIVTPRDFANLCIANDCMPQAKQKKNDEKSPAPQTSKLELLTKEAKLPDWVRPEWSRLAPTVHSVLKMVGFDV